MTGDFTLDPPTASVAFQKSVADFLKMAQLDAFTGKIILHMHEGHVRSIEPHHAPIPVERLTAK